MDVRHERQREARLLEHFARAWIRHGGNEVADGLVGAMVMTDELLERVTDPHKRERAAEAVAERVEEIRREADARVLMLLVDVARQVRYEPPPRAEERPANVIDLKGWLEAAVARQRSGKLTL